LGTRLESDPDAPQGVLVTFVQTPSDELLSELGLVGGSTTIATGVCKPSAIAALASRPDVLRIDPVVEPDLAQPIDRPPATDEG
jgi:hypothetical protein